MMSVPRGFNPSVFLWGALHGNLVPRSPGRGAGCLFRCCALGLEPIVTAVTHHHLLSGFEMQGLESGMRDGLFRHRTIWLSSSPQQGLQQVKLKSPTLPCVWRHARKGAYFIFHVYFNPEREWHCPN